MFYGKKIKELEARVIALEGQVKELTVSVSEQNSQIDALVDLFKAQQAKAPLVEEVTTKPAQTQKPKYRPKKKNGKENPAAAE